MFLKANFKQQNSFNDGNMHNMNWFGQGPVHHYPGQENNPNNSTTTNNSCVTYPRVENEMWHLSQLTTAFVESIQKVTAEAILNAKTEIRVTKFRKHAIKIDEIHKGVSN
ncbi:hypothetical protein BDR05DRAFT_953070 [Suillus weaverae]|nr:hypothetical protein BDR05DRAFT_953070 [Suillus weaverae]